MLPSCNPERMEVRNTIFAAGEAIDQRARGDGLDCDEMRTRDIDLTARSWRQLVRSGRTKSFASGRWNGRPRMYLLDKRRCSRWKTE